jgi:ComF family protein
VRFPLHFALDLLFPRICPPCGGPLAPGTPTPLCAACHRDLATPLAVGCSRCGVPAAGIALDACAACRVRPPAFATARALGPYVADGAGNVLARVVQQLKYHGGRALAAPLADLLASRYPFALDALLVPVPLHRSRLRSRGYNQALLLARGLARRRGLALAPRLLERTRPTAEHAHLDAAARRRNVREAFRLRAGGALAGRTVVLVDDVLTTGATADACARALHAGGAGAVHVFTVGRTP